VLVGGKGGGTYQTKVGSLCMGNMHLRDIDAELEFSAAAAKLADAYVGVEGGGEGEVRKTCQANDGGIYLGTCIWTIKPLRWNRCSCPTQITVKEVCGAGVVSVHLPPLELL
jgi:hypothetical protein